MAKEFGLGQIVEQQINEILERYFDAQSSAIKVNSTSFDFGPPQIEQFLESGHIREFLRWEKNPMHQFVHALKHDIASSGIYTLDMPAQRFCPDITSENPCLATSPADLVRLLNRIRRSTFGLRVGNVWKGVREDPERYRDYIMQVKSRDIGSAFYSLTGAKNHPQLHAYFSLDSRRFSASAVINITEPEKGSNLFQTSTSFELGRNNPKHFASASTEFPTVAATVFKIVCDKVSLR